MTDLRSNRRRLTGDGPSQESLAGPGRSDHEHTPGPDGPGPGVAFESQLLVRSTGQHNPIGCFFAVEGAPRRRFLAMTELSIPRSFSRNLVTAES